MADLAKIKRNVAKMSSMNAPIEDIDGYISSEGVTVDDVRNFKEQKGISKNVEQVIGGAVAGVTGLQPTPRDIPGMVASFVNGLLMNQPETLLRYPAQYSLAGPVGANIAAGANIPAQLSDVASAVTGGQVPRLPKAIEDSGVGLPQAETAGGKIASGILDIAGGGVGANVLPKVSKSATGLIYGRTPADRYKKAEKLTTELLQPPTASMEYYATKGQQHPAVREAVKVIQKSKNYEDLKNKIGAYTTRIMDIRNKLIKRYNAPIGGTYIKELEKYITQQRRSGQVPESELATLNDVLLKEIKWYRRQRKMNVVKAEERKEALERVTESLLEKREKGEIVDRDPARNRALDVLRRALKDKIELRVPDRVKEINASYGGLREAKRLLARQEGLAKKAIEQNLIGRILEYVQGLKGDIPMAVARRASAVQKSIPRKTGKIEQLYKLSQKP